MSRTEPAPLPRLNPLVGATVVLTMATYLALTEIDHLVGQVLDDSRVYTPTGLTSSFRPAAGAEGWLFLAGDGQNADDRLGGWLTAYGLLDLLFTLLYGAALVIAAKSLPAGSRLLALREPPLAPRGIGRRAVLAPLVVGIGADVLENVLIAAGGHWPEGLAMVAHVLPWISIVKWSGLLLGVVWLIRARREMRRMLPTVTTARGVRNYAFGLYTHRYSLVVVLPLAVLGLARGPDLLEQVPDIQRRWADSSDLGSAAWAGGLSVALVFITFVIGRLRTHHLSVRREPPAPLPAQPPLWFWLVSALVVLAGALVAKAAGMDVLWRAWAVFFTVPSAVWVGSLLVKHCSDASAPRRAQISQQRFSAGAWIGDVLPVSLLIVVGLGAVRSFSGAVALGGAPGLAKVGLVGGAALAVFAWYPYCWLLRLVAQHADSAGVLSYVQRGGLSPRGSGWVVDRFVVLVTPGLEAQGSDRQRFRRILAWLLSVGAAAGFVALGTAPQVAARIGVVAAFQLALGLLAIALAAVVIALQASGSPQAFWLVPLRVPFTPITTLVVGACLVAGIFGGSGPVHRVRTLDDGTRDVAAARPALPTLFRAWLTAGQQCATKATVRDGADVRMLTVRPLFLYAAEGGGIRAAYWTALGVDTLAAAAHRGVADVCGRAFLSSGASGGAVGLTVASVVTPGAAADAVRSIADERALAEATVGMVIRDSVYAASGIPLPIFTAGDHTRWRDRAALIEDAWSDPEHGIEQLSTPFLRAHPAWSDWGAPGALVLNSTSATSGCRALVSQVRLLPEDGGTRACLGDQPVAGSIDVLRCTQQITSATAGMLAARFPYVTPSGVVSCLGDAVQGLTQDQDPRDQQLVDGGYAENTGIGTQVDLASDWLPLVRQHNECALVWLRVKTADDKPAARAAAEILSDCEKTEPAPDTLVVPLLVYFDNGTGSDLVSDGPNSQLEVLVPPHTISNAKASLYSASSQLQRAEAMFALESVGLAPVAPAIRAWQCESSDACPSAYVVYQTTEPGISAPLGWVLSNTSMSTMDTSMTEHQVPLGEYGSLVDLMRLVR